MCSWPLVSAPTDAVIIQHDDDTKQPPHQTHPHLPPTQKEPNSTPQFLSPQPTTDDSVNSTLDKINKMMSSWLLAIDHEPWMMTMPTATPPPLTPAQVPSQLPPNSTIPEVTHHLHNVISLESSINCCDDDNRPKPHDVHPLLSLQDTFDLQLQVLEKINKVCDGLNNLLD